MKIPLLDLKAQYAPLRAEIRAAMDEVCDEQQFILGTRVQAFETHMAAYCGAPYAIGLSSGTDALLAALMALDIGPGDAVITSPFTFFATLGSIVRLGAFPLRGHWGQGWTLGSAEKVLSPPWVWCDI